MWGEKNCSYAVLDRDFIDRRPCIANLIFSKRLVDGSSWPRPRYEMTPHQPSALSFWFPVSIFSNLSPLWNGMLSAWLLVTQRSFTYNQRFQIRGSNSTLSIYFARFFFSQVVSHFTSLVASDWRSSCCRPPFFHLVTMESPRISNRHAPLRLHLNLLSWVLLAFVMQSSARPGVWGLNNSQTSFNNNVSKRPFCVFIQLFPDFLLFPFSLSPDFHTFFLKFFCQFVANLYGPPSCCSVIEFFDK